MPDMIPGAPPPGGAPPPQPGAGGGAPSTGGPSPAMMPVANRGMEAAGMARLGLIVKLMGETVPMLGAASDAGQALIKALSALSRHVAEGSQSPGVEAAAMQNLQNQARQNAMRIAAMRAQSAQAPNPGAPPALPPPMQPQMAA